MSFSSRADVSNHPWARSLFLVGLGVAIGLAIGLLIGGGKREAVNSRSSIASNSNTVDRQNAGSSSHAAQDSADKILLGNITTVPFQELYDLLSKRSPSEIAQMAKQLDALPAGRETNGKIETFFKAWSHIDPRAAFKAASGLKTTEARDTAITATLSGSDPTAASWLARSLVELPEDALSTMNKAGLFAMIVQKWGETDAPAAAKFFDEHPQKGMSFTMAGYSIAQTWAATDPAAAMAWASEHRTGPMGGSALSGAISGWWQKDRAGAEAYALAHANGPDAMQFMTALVGPMVRDNPQRALAWVAQLPNDGIKRQTETMLASMWAVNDPQAASQWAAGLPNERSSNALASTMSFWAQSDPQAASRWLETLNGTPRDNAIGAFSSGLVSKDPATALKWVDAIGDPTIRQRALHQVISLWLFQDPVTARAWIENSSLSADEKGRFLASKPGG